MREAILSGRSSKGQQQKLARLEEEEEEAVAEEEEAEVEWAKDYIERENEQKSAAAR